MYWIICFSLQRLPALSFLQTLNALVLRWHQIPGVKVRACGQWSWKQALYSEMCSLLHRDWLCFSLPKDPPQAAFSWALDGHLNPLSLTHVAVVLWPLQAFTSLWMNDATHISSCLCAATSWWLLLWVTGKPCHSQCNWSENGKSDSCDQTQILWSLKTEPSEACLWVRLSLPVPICSRNSIPSSGVGCVLCFPELLPMQLLSQAGQDATWQWASKTLLNAQYSFLLPWLYFPVCSLLCLCWKAGCEAAGTWLCSRLMGCVQLWCVVLPQAGDQRRCRSHATISCRRRGGEYVACWCLNPSRAHSGQLGSGL